MLNMTFFITSMADSCCYLTEKKTRNYSEALTREACSSGAL